MSSSTSNLLESAKDVGASVVGSAACVYSGQPFDTVKVRMQVQPGLNAIAALKLTVTDSGPGMFSLWRGSMPALMGALSENAVAFALNGLLKRLATASTSPSSSSSSTSLLSNPFVTGGLTGGCTAFVLCPCDVIKCRAQLSRSAGLSAGFREVLQSTWQTQGFRGFYTGIGIQVIRDIPFYASFFGSYELLCKYFKENTKMNDATIYFTSGGLAGQIAWVASIAADTIKSQIQTSLKPKGILETMQEITSTRGVRGLFAGIEVAIIRAFPANAALFVGYEYARKFMG